MKWLLRAVEEIVRNCIFSICSWQICKIFVEYKSPFTTLKQCYGKNPPFLAWTFSPYMVVWKYFYRYSIMVGIFLVMADRIVSPGTSNHSPLEIRHYYVRIMIWRSATCKLVALTWWPSLTDISNGCTARFCFEINSLVHYHLSVEVLQWWKKTITDQTQWFYSYTDHYI